MIENGPNDNLDLDLGNVALDSMGDNDFPGGDFEGENHHRVRNMKSRNATYFEELNQTKKAIVDQLLGLYDVDWEYKLTRSPWEEAASWVQSRQITPNQATSLGKILSYPTHLHPLISNQSLVIINH